MENTNPSEARRYNRIISEIDELYHDLAVRQGFSDSAMSILYELSDHGGQCRLGDLLRLSCLSKQTANSALRNLEKEGIVYLESAGGRSKRVCLTRKGFAVTHDTVDRIIDVENRIYSSWSAEEWAIYVELTERYLHQLREEMKEIL